MVEARGLRKRFGRLEVLRGIDLTIARNRVTAIVGPNAAGKTTLIKAILGLVRPQGGTIVVDGAQIGARSIIGANSLVPQRFTCPPGSMVYGSPAKVVRPLTDAEQASLRPWAEKYVAVGTAHAALM